jgi:flagellar biosynthesis protein FlhA
VPALIVSTSAGIVVSRAAAESHLGLDISRQLFSGHRPLAIVGGTLCVLAFVPGLPMIPFLLLAAVASGLGYTIHRGRKAAAMQDKAPEEPAAPAAEVIEDLIKVDRLELVIGYGLISMIDPSEGGDFLERVNGIRRQIAVDLGIVVPRIRIRDDVRLKPYEYELKLKGARVARGEVYPGQFLAIGDAARLNELDGAEAVDPAFGLPAKWLDGEGRDRALGLGLTVVEAPVALGTHLSEIIRTHAGEILSRQDVKDVLDDIKKESPAAIEEAIPQVVSLGMVHRVMQNLLREQVPVRDVLTILETMTDYGHHTKDADVLTEYVRGALQRTICNICEDETGVIYAATLDPRVEQVVAESVQATKSGITAVLKPNVAQKIISAIEGVSRNMAAGSHRAIIICSPNVRLPLRRLIEHTLPRVMVISFGEISPDCEVHSIGMVKTNDEN